MLNWVGPCLGGRLFLLPGTPFLHIYRHWVSITLQWVLFCAVSGNKSAMRQKVKSAYEPSGSSGGSLSQFLWNEQLGVFLLPPGWDASPSQGYLPTLSSPVPLLYTWMERGTVRVNVLPKNTTQCSRPGLEPGPLHPETSALTMRFDVPSSTICVGEETRHPDRRKCLFWFYLFIVSL